jgi:hypothetical protein
MNPFQASEIARAEIIATGLSNGNILCPICGNQMAFTVHSNGHVHASCEDPRCLHWME